VPARIAGAVTLPVELNRWLARAVLAIVAGLIPWTAYLAWSLPGHFRAHNWRLAWVGFDVGLIVVLAYTAWAAWTRRQILAPTAIVAATMLICDAWFDVNTSFATKGEALTIVTALGGNLPLALVFILLARRIMLRSAAALAEARGTDDRPRHARDVTMPFDTTWHDDTMGLRVQPGPVRDSQEQGSDDSRCGLGGPAGTERSDDGRT